MPSQRGHTAALGKSFGHASHCIFVAFLAFHAFPEGVHKSHVSHCICAAFLAFHACPEGVHRSSHRRSWAWSRKENFFLSIQLQIHQGAFSIQACPKGSYRRSWACSRKEKYFSFQSNSRFISSNCFQLSSISSFRSQFNWQPILPDCDVGFCRWNNF